MKKKLKRAYTLTMEASPLQLPLSKEQSRELAHIIVKCFMQQRSLRKTARTARTSESKTDTVPKPDSNL